jgi:hypothetical protein
VVSNFDRVATQAFGLRSGFRHPARGDGGFLRGDAIRLRHARGGFPRFTISLRIR